MLRNRSCDAWADAATPLVAFYLVGDDEQKKSGDPHV